MILFATLTVKIIGRMQGFGKKRKLGPALASPKQKGVLQKSERALRGTKKKTKKRQIRVRAGAGPAPRPAYKPRRPAPPPRAPELVVFVVFVKNRKIQQKAPDSQTTSVDLVSCESCPRAFLSSRQWVSTARHRLSTAGNASLTG